MYEALQELCTLLKEESMLSSYEIQTSGLVTALNNCLNKVNIYYEVAFCFLIILVYLFSVNNCISISYQRYYV